MSNPVTPEIVCHRCKAALDAADNYCRRCGAPTTAGAAAGAAWWESPWVVLPLLFVVLGPFALPLLWKSRRFSRPWKIALSVITVVLTLYMAWELYYALDRALAPLRDWEKSGRF